VTALSFLVLTLAVATAPPAAGVTPRPAPGQVTQAPATANTPASKTPPVAFVGVDDKTPVSEVALLFWNQTDDDVKRKGILTTVAGLRRRVPGDGGTEPVRSEANGTGARAGATQPDVKWCRMSICASDLGKYRVAAVAPGSYDVSVWCDTPMLHGSATERHEFVAGKRYRVACTSRARQRVRFEVTEL